MRVLRLEERVLCAEFGGVGFLRMSTIRVTELMEFLDGVMFSVYVGFTWFSFTDYLYVLL